MEIDKIIEKIINSLKIVDGVDSIVLGGSRARGNFTEKSDIDIGIYYNDNLDIKKLDTITKELDDDHRENIITQIGEWGPWINGGGWLKIDGIQTDFLFRDLNRVQKVKDDCMNGKITIDYQPGHPHGFVNTIYLAEIFYCKVLFCKSNIISELKEDIVSYPKKIQYGIIDKFLWEAKFSSMIARKSLYKNDIIYTIGNLYRIISCVIQVVYALNKTYIMNEKGAVSYFDNFIIIPNTAKSRINKIFYNIEKDNTKIISSLDDLDLIISDLDNLYSKLGIKGE